MWEAPTVGDMDMRDIIASAGGVKRLAEAVKRHHATVLGWRRVPSEHARRVSEVTGIPRHELRPDLWEPPSGAAGLAVVPRESA